jgi:plasmid stabilization system protein ParE
MTGCALHPEAYSDLDAIWEFIADDNIDAADRVIAEIFEALRALTTFPHQGRRRPDLTSRLLRFGSCAQLPDCLRAGSKAAWVVAVLHGRRSPRVIAAILRGRE